MRPSSLWVSNDSDWSAASPGQGASNASVPVNLVRDQIYERAMRFTLQVIALE